MGCNRYNYFENGSGDLETQPGLRKTFGLNVCSFDDHVYVVHWNIAQ